MENPRMKTGGHHFSDNITKYIEELDIESDHGYNPYKQVDVGEQDFCMCYGVINSDLMLTLIKYGSVSLNGDRFNSCILNLSKHLYQKYAMTYVGEYINSVLTVSEKDFENEAMTIIMESLEKECGYKLSMRLINNPAKLKLSKSGGLTRNGKLIILEKLIEGK